MKGKEEKRGDPKDNLWGSPRRGESQKDPPGGLDGGEEREKERGMERWRGTQLGQILPQILPKERETLRRTPGGPRDPGTPGAPGRTLRVTLRSSTTPYPLS